MAGLPLDANRPVHDRDGDDHAVHRTRLDRRALPGPRSVILVRPAHRSAAVHRRGDGGDDDHPLGVGRTRGSPGDGRVHRLVVRGRLTTDWGAAVGREWIRFATVPPSPDGAVVLGGPARRPSVVGSTVLLVLVAVGVGKGLVVTVVVPSPLAGSAAGCGWLAMCSIRRAPLDGRGAGLRWGARRPRALLGRRALLRGRAAPRGGVPGGCGDDVRFPPCRSVRRWTRRATRWWARARPGSRCRDRCAPCSARSVSFGTGIRRAGTQRDLGPQRPTAAAGRQAGCAPPSPVRPGALGSRRRPAPGRRGAGCRSAM